MFVCLLLLVVVVVVVFVITVHVSMTLVEVYCTESRVSARRMASLEQTHVNNPSRLMPQLENLR